MSQATSVKPQPGQSTGEILKFESAVGIGVMLQCASTIQTLLSDHLDPNGYQCFPAEAKIEFVLALLFILLTLYMVVVRALHIELHPRVKLKS